MNFQARLHEIITSESKIVHTNGSEQFPWMVDGAGLPPNASQFLPKLVITYRGISLSYIPPRLRSFLSRIFVNIVGCQVAFTLNDLDEHESRHLLVKICFS